MKFGI